jgi:tetratricopeptide (TPR) repeat protein
VVLWYGDALLLTRVCCILLQALYIPEGWYHASQTSSDHSVSVRYSPPHELPGAFYYYLVRGDAKRAAGDYTAAVKLYRLGLALQRDITIVTHMGMALEQLGLYVEAESAYTEAVERNPRNAQHYVRLANLLVSHAVDDSSVKVGNLLQRADSFGLKEKVLLLLKDAF